MALSDLEESILVSKAFRKSFHDDHLSLLGRPQNGPRWRKTLIAPWFASAPAPHRPT